MTGLESMTSKTRITLARASWPIVIRLVSARTGADHLPDVEGEGEEHPEGDRAVHGQPAAQREHPDLAEHGTAPSAGL
jgi:hypothetical protein